MPGRAIAPPTKGIIMRIDFSRRTFIAGGAAAGLLMGGPARAAAGSGFAGDADLLERAYTALHPGLYRYNSRGADGRQLRPAARRAGDGRGPARGLSGARRGDGGGALRPQLSELLQPVEGGQRCAARRPHPAAVPFPLERRGHDRHARPERRGAAARQHDRRGRGHAGARDAPPPDAAGPRRRPQRRQAPRAARGRRHRRIRDVRHLSGDGAAGGRRARGGTDRRGRSGRAAVCRRGAAADGRRAPRACAVADRAAEGCAAVAADPARARRRRPDDADVERLQRHVGLGPLARNGARRRRRRAHADRRPARQRGWKRLRRRDRRPDDRPRSRSGRRRPAGPLPRRFPPISRPMSRRGTTASATGARRRSGRGRMASTISSVATTAARRSARRSASRGGWWCSSMR